MFGAISGPYAVDRKNNVPCLIYVTFNRVVMYYNITMAQIVTSDLIETMEKQEGTQDLLNFFNCDCKKYSSCSS